MTTTQMTPTKLLTEQQRKQILDQTVQLLLKKVANSSYIHPDDPESYPISAETDGDDIPVFLWIDIHLRGYTAQVNDIDGYYTGTDYFLESFSYDLAIAYWQANSEEDENDIWYTFPLTEDERQYVLNHFIYEWERNYQSFRD